ncbi:MAG: cytochrome c peroxidase [Lonepinella koalarum]|nr:cytochrome c peroxidase [Lonepinella koalarum]
MKYYLFVFSLFLQTAVALEKEPRVMPTSGIDKALLGQILFFDQNLSHHRSQSCASCHNQDTAFVDNRDNHFEKAVSQGDNPTKFGKRNSPTIMYSKYSPVFHFDPELQEYVGGQFWDGRAKHLTEQAGMPLIDPMEMGMVDKLDVAKRVIEEPMYVKLLSQHYGEQIWQHYEKVYVAIEDALATFQQQKKLLSPFDSKYDKFLKNEAKLTALEQKGMEIFFDKSRSNCSTCHQFKPFGDLQETFTNYRYYNIGVPKNQRLIMQRHVDENFVDNGLFDNPQVNGDVTQKGKFKVPTLRNVAVTAPYMHNGALVDLRTVLSFLNNPNLPKERQDPQFSMPEYAETIAHQYLKASPLTEEEIDALIAFLETLTDERYLPLLEKQKAEKGSHLLK